MHSILVPTDFSFGANRAIDYAIRLAKKSKTSLVVLHVCHLLEYSFNDREVSVKQYNDIRIEEFFQQLSQLKEVIESTEGVPVQTKLYEGNLSNCIEKIANELDVSLVVMGTKGATGFTGRVIGSQTVAVMRHCTLPVLAVPAIYEGDEIQHVVLAIKEDEEIKNGLETTFELVALFGARLKVLNCSTDREEAYEVMDDTRKLHHFMQRIQKSYPALGVEQEHIGGRNIYNALTSYMETHPVDLLVMVAYHHEWIQLLSGKSTTQKMALTTEIPLLVLPSEIER